MDRFAHLDWPFFEPRHAELARRAESWAAANLGYALDGIKTWISNGGIADFYIVFARTGQESGTKTISAFVVDADAPGLSIEERIEIVAPHPMATLRFSACKVPAANLLGAEGEGFK